MREANILNGGGDIDTMQGLAGNDRYYVDNAADVIEEIAAGGTQDRALTSTSYQLKVGVRVEELMTTSAAGTSAINLFGNEFGQLIVGNSGSNIINGLAGSDTLRGYLGNDFFIFDSALGAGNIDTHRRFLRRRRHDPARQCNLHRIGCRARLDASRFPDRHGSGGRARPRHLQQRDRSFAVR